jgi:serine/threonine protein kinase
MSSPKDESPLQGTQMLATGDLSAGPPLPAQGGDGDPISGRTLDGRYKVGERLGAGGVGVVYAAEHVEIRKAVALKVLHPAFGQNEGLRLRFEREARAASQLSHPACVSVIDFGRVARVDPAEGGQPLLGMSYLVMERVRGDVLGERTHGQKLDPKEAIDIVRGVLSALRHAHGLGLVHRDVKPGNVMLSKPGEERWVKLLDFGLAKSLISTDERPLTEAGMVFGTPGYLSPEQAGANTVDARSDLYSTGVLLFELLCGRPPFIGEDRIQVVRDHLLTPPPALRSLVPELTPALEAVVMRSLSKKPDDRYPTAEAFSEALAAVPEANLTAPIPSPLPRTERPLVAALRRLSLPQQVLAGGVLVLLLVGLGLLFRPTRAEVPTPPPTAVPVPQPPRGESRHMKLALDYQRKLWCSDALDELEKAVREDASIGASPPAIDIAVGCLRQKTQDKAVRFLVDNAGQAALSALAEVESKDSRADYRYGAARARAAILAHPRP